MKEYDVAIIGGGFSGLMVLCQLIEYSDRKLNLCIINRSEIIGKGIAYSAIEEYLLLNVPAEKMSAFPDDHLHFLNWIKNKYNQDAFGRYLPRRMYGEYLNSIFDSLKIKALNKDLTLNTYATEARGIELSNNGYRINFENKLNINAKKVVLATGNEHPSFPQNCPIVLQNSSIFFNNPWNGQFLQHINNCTNTILIFGTGLSMADSVLMLMRNGFKGKIIALSRHGYRLIPHSNYNKSKINIDLSDTLASNSLLEMVAKFNKLRKQIIPIDALVDALRPHISELWQKLSEIDKRKFTYRCRHLWGVVRHRLPNDVYIKLQELIEEGRLNIVKGYVKTFDESSKICIIQDKKDNKEIICQLDIAINCTGPEMNLVNSENPILQSLIDKVDKSDFGGLFVDNCTFQVKKDNQIIKGLYSIGNLLRGQLWESTAVAELRVQAKHIASHILSK